MATDLLRTQANERVDLVDFEFLSQDAPREMARQPMAQFFTNPNGPKRAWILRGFEMSNPVGKQLLVTRGRAILGYRQGGLTYHGLLTTEGDASKTVDMAPLSSGTYNVYVRFEYIAGDSSSRIFWNPAGTGRELAQTVPTRLKANWSLRVETASPGAEWYKVGTASNSGEGLVLVDQRDLYFEGAVESSFQSGWSSDGGGSADDRADDRQQHGVTDLQTFTAAMRQCVEDIKGRGLRRWWERDIGGLNVGFDADPAEDRIAVGDAEYYLLNDGTHPRLVFDDAGDAIWFDRSANRIHLDIGGSTILEVRDSDLRVRGDIIPVARTDSVGSAADPWGDLYAGTIHAGTIEPLNSSIILAADAVPDVDSQHDFGTNTERWATGYFDDLRVTGSVFAHDNDFGLSGNATAPTFYWDSLDYVRFDRGGDEYNWVIGDTTKMWLGGSGLIVRDGLVVGTDNGTTPVADAVLVGDKDCFLRRVSADDQRLGFDANDYLQYADDTYRFVIGGSVQMELAGAGLNVQGGLVVGDTSTTPTNDHAIIAGGLSVGHIGSPGSREIQVGDASFKLDYVGSNEVRIAFDGSDGYLEWNRWQDTSTTGELEIYQKQSSSVERRMKISAYRGGSHPRRGVGFEGDRFILACGFDVDNPDWAFTSGVKAAVAIGGPNYYLRYSDDGSFQTSMVCFKDEGAGGLVNPAYVSCHHGSTANLLTWYDQDSIWHRENKYNWLLGYGSANMELAIHSMHGTTPSMGNSYAGLYTEHVGDTAELFAMDDADNATQISPHDPNTGEWYLNSFSRKRSVTIKVWLERLVAAVEQLTGKTFMEVLPGNQIQVATEPPTNSQ